MRKDLEDMLRKGAEELGVTMDDRAVEAFAAYLHELRVWSRKMNLTTVTDERGVVSRHFLDSLTPLSVVPGRGRVLDMGTGAGFPGLPMKIARPGLEVTLMDGVRKKVHFLRHVIRKLGLTGAEAVHARAEDDPVVEKYAGHFDVVVSRALTETADFLALARPYLAPGGLVVAMKGPLGEGEAVRAGDVEGLEGVDVRTVEVPFAERATTLLVYRREG